MTTLREAAQQALEALERYSGVDQRACDAEDALRTALEQQEQEPVASAWIRDGVMVNAFPWPPGDPRGRDEDQYWQRKGYTASPLYTHPPRREWQGLTTQEAMALTDTAPKGVFYGCDAGTGLSIWIAAVAAAERALKEKNNG